MTTEFLDDLLEKGWDSCMCNGSGIYYDAEMPDQYYDCPVHKGEATPEFLENTRRNIAEFAEGWRKLVRKHQLAELRLRLLTLKSELADGLLDDPSLFWNDYRSLRDFRRINRCLELIRGRTQRE